MKKKNHARSRPVSNRSKKQETIGVILGASKVRDELVPIAGDIPSTLIPINNRPTVFLIIDHMKSQGIKKVYVAVGYQSEKVERLLTAYPQEKNFAIHVVPVDASKKSGTTLASVMLAVSPEDAKSTVYVHAADTLPTYDLPLPFNKNFILVAPHEHAHHENVCVVRTKTGDSRVHALHEKKCENGEVSIIGVYHFTDQNLFSRIPLKDYDVSFFLERLLKRSLHLEALAVSKWFDVGRLTEYYEAQTHRLPTRSFNQLVPGGSRNTIFKRSKHNDKLKEEILWYVNLPEELKIHAPRVMSHCVEGDDIYAELEFYGYPSLSSLWVYETLPEAFWRIVIDRMIDVVDTFRKHPRTVDLADYIDTYATKTEERARAGAASDPRLAALYGASSVVINGVELSGWPTFRRHLKEYARALYNTDDNCFLHGDLCFPNILFDLNCGIVKLIDPRGVWGTKHLSGDIKYDVAKLRHSVSGNVDHMLYNHVDVSFSPERSNKQPPSITYSFPLTSDIQKGVAEYADQKISERWDLNQIKLIEGLLFISMIPLHADSKKRQLAMFARGIVLLNEITNSTSRRLV